MTNTQKLLLNSISDSLWRNRQASALPAELLDEARLHAVDGLIQPVSYEKIAFFIRYTYAEKQLIDLLNTNNVPFVILKGTAAAIYYPEPYRRSFGDIDFLVPAEFFSEAIQLMKSDGYSEAKVQGDLEREYVFIKDGYAFELHKCFSYPDLDIEQYVSEGVEKRETAHINEHEFPMLPPLANGIVLLAHMRAHLKSGIGLRQVIDWMMYCAKVLDEEFWSSSFKPVLDDLGLTTLAVTAAALCQRYLGLTDSITWCCEADEALVDQLLRVLLSSGNFGVKNSSGNNVETVTAAIRSHGLFRYLQHAGENNWTLYHRYSWLRPLCWLYQVFRYIRQGIGRGNKLKEDLRRGNDRYELLKRLGIS